MRIELINCEATLLREIADRRTKRRDVAQTYRLAMESSESERVNWIDINLAITARWSTYGLQWIKESAWSGRCFNETGKSKRAA